MPTDTLAVPELDERTREELQPPCEVRLKNGTVPCGHAAGWIVTTACDNCGHMTCSALWCAEHKDRAVNGGLWLCISGCAQRVILSVKSAEKL